MREGGRLVLNTCRSECSLVPRLYCPAFESWRVECTEYVVKAGERTLGARLFERSNR